jgi:glycosyltransferase involved in cell wall biosynthesis
LFVGQFIGRKGISVLIEAFAQVHKRFSSCLLVLVGDGPERIPCVDITRRLGISDAVIFAGTPDTSILPIYYRAADVFVLPSFQEGFGIVILEAMASGTPVIASRIRGITDAIRDGTNGILVPPGDERRLADKIIEFFNDDATRVALAEQGRATAFGQYDWPVIMRKWDEVLHRLLRSHRSFER